jgi:phage terminase small subunit
MTTTAKRSPAHLHPAEAVIWRAILAEWNCTGASLVVLELALAAAARAREAREILEADGLTIRGRDGQVMVHPMISAERAASRAFLAALKAMGIKL